MDYVLKPVEALRSPENPPLGEVLDELARILREWRVKAIREANGIAARGDAARLEALRLLGARLAPIALGEGETWADVDELDPYWDLTPRPGRVYHGALDLLTGEWPTPLVRLKSLSRRGVRVWAKLEAFNPFSWSVKDRVGWALATGYIEEEGRPPRLVYEATSTNTGMALAGMAAIYGFKLRAYIPASIQRASDTLLAAMGAEVVRLPYSLTVESLGLVRREAERDGAVNLDQFNNDGNLMVHIRYTAREIDYQARMAGLRLRGIIGGIGTSGHMSAIGFYHKHRSRGETRIYCVQPAPGEKIPGIRRVETGMKWIGLAKPDRIVDVTRREAVEAVLSVARREGLLVGLSSGAATAGFLKLLEEGLLEDGDYIIVYPDNGLKYVEQIKAHLEGGGGGGLHHQG